MNEGIYIVQCYKLRNVYLNPKKFAYEIIISWITGHKLFIYKFQLNNSIDLLNYIWTWWTHLDMVLSASENFWLLFNVFNISRPIKISVSSCLSFGRLCLLWNSSTLSRLSNLCIYIKKFLLVFLHISTRV